MNRISINLEIKDANTLPQRRVEDEYVPTGLTVNNRSYVEIKQYCQTYGNESDATVRRLLKKVEHDRCNEFFIKMANKIYVSPNISMLTNKNFSRLDTISGNWEKFIRGFEWDYFGCVRFKWSMSTMTLKSRMTKYFEKLGKKYNTASIRMFYTVEQNPEGGDGYHVHFLLWTDITNKNEVKSLTENHFRGNGTSPSANSLIEKYDPKKGGVGYLLKQLHRNPDGYDYLYKNNPASNN